jgi:acyl-CoA-binding protein
MGRALAVSVAVTVAVSAASLLAWFVCSRRSGEALDRILRSLSRRRTNDQSGSSSTAEIVDENDKTDKDRGGSSCSQQQHLDERFSEAASAVRSAKGLSARDRLALYGLYKQATAGDAPPGAGDAGAGGILGWAEARAKRDAWNRRRGASRLDASRQYVELASVLLLHQQQDAETAATNASSSLVSSEDNFRDDDEEEDDDRAGGDDATASAFAAPRVSQPVLGLEDDDDDDADDCHGSSGLNGNGGGSSSDLSRDRSRQLLAAASKNDAAALRRILASHPGSADAADGSGQTALHLASDRGNLECVRILLKSGADVSAADRDGISVLQAAVIAGHADVCRTLLEGGADPDQPDVDGDTPRSCAADDGSEALLALFEALPP